MAWKQVKDANWRIPYVGGLCEGYVEGAWGKATLPTRQNPMTYGVHFSATAAWNAEPNKHYDLPPAGITVPVYFSLGSTPYGHVAIRLDDLNVASSTNSGYNQTGYLHPNIQHLINLYAQYNKGCTYLGWGEHVGGMRVVEWVETNKGGDTVETIKSMYWRLMGREADAGGIKTYTAAATQKGWDFVYNDLKNSPEGQADWQWRNPDRVRALEKNIADRDEQIADLKKALTNEKNKPPVEIIKEVEKIVEKEVEVIREVPTAGYDEQTVITNWLTRLWNSLFKKEK